jgi:O-antigen ligase
MLFATEGRNRVFIKFILLVYPLIQLDMVPGEFSIATFDFITLVFFIFFYKRRTVKVRGGNIYLFLFLLITLASIVGCTNAESLTVDTLVEFIKLAAVFIFAKILIDECIEDSSFFYSVISCLKVSLIVSLLFLVGQFIFGLGFTISKSQNPNVMAEGIRYTSYFQDPQKYAQFLSCVSFLFLIKNETKQKISYGSYLLVFFSLLALLFTGGRGGLGGWFAGLLVVIMFSKSNYRIAAFLICLLLVFVMYNFKDDLVMFKRTSLAESYEVRNDIWKDAIGIYKKNPYFGIGLGNYANYVSFHNPDQYWLVDNEMIFFDHPESGYLKFLTELGLSGFISVLLIILIPIIRAFGAFFRNKDISNLLIIAAIVSWLIGFYTVYSFTDVRIKVLIVTLLCLLIVNYNKAQLEKVQ